MNKSSATWKLELLDSTFYCKSINAKISATVTNANPTNLTDVPTCVAFQPAICTSAVRTAGVLLVYAKGVAYDCTAALRCVVHQIASSIEKNAEALLVGVDIANVRSALEIKRNLKISCLLF